MPLALTAPLLLPLAPAPRQTSHIQNEAHVRSSEHATSSEDGQQLLKGTTNLRRPAISNSLQPFLLSKRRKLGAKKTRKEKNMETKCSRDCPRDFWRDFVYVFFSPVRNDLKHTHKHHLPPIQSWDNAAHLFMFMCFSFPEKRI